MKSLYESILDMDEKKSDWDVLRYQVQTMTGWDLSDEKEMFLNHYQLADYIYKFAEKTVPDSEMVLGDVETLFKVLQRQNRLTKKKVDNDLRKIQLVLSSGSIADHMMDLYSLDNRKGSIEIIKIRASKDPLNDKYINHIQLIKHLIKKINHLTLFCF